MSQKKLSLLISFFLVCICTEAQVLGEFDINKDKNVDAADITSVLKLRKKVQNFVDLGLSSGTLWATKNLGAEKIEDYGDYFAWADVSGYISGKTTFNWSTCRYSDDTGSSFAKYNTKDSFGNVDNTTVLELVDDAAYVNNGKDWIIPTKDQWDELRSECTWEWTTYEGVSGRLVTGPNGNTIFLPAAGYLKDTSIYNDGKYGIYWSSTLSSDSPDKAYYVYFSSGNVYPGTHYRYLGQSVRPVAANGGTASGDLNGDGVIDKQDVETVVDVMQVGNGVIKCVNEIILSNRYACLQPTETIDLDATVLPEDAVNKSVKWKSSDTNVATIKNGVVKAISAGTAIITCRAADGSGTSTSCTVRVSVPEYIDLGLSSGTLWATTNIGAIQPEDYGDYFAWGETTTKHRYEWATYKYCEGTSSTLTKYNTDSSYGVVDNLSELEAEDDAAYVNWGREWRMPTDAQRIELIEECTWTWEKYNDVYGRRVTGPNGNSIFMPAAGFYARQTLCDAGIRGTCWMSTLDANEPQKGYRMHFYSGELPRFHDEKFYGETIRPVRSTVKIASIVLNEDSVVLERLSTVELIPELTPSDAANIDVVWSSSNSEVATVKNGLVKALSAGTAVITCKAADGSGKKATCKVNVPLKVSKITLSSASLILEKSSSYTLEATVAPSDADNPSVVWSSSNDSVATVANGFVRAISAGTATITCSAVDGSGASASCTVKVWEDHSGIIDGHSYVDLGLPSGTLWATVNLGADNPEDYGDYFAWGEASAKPSYLWETYIYCDSLPTSLTKYNYSGDYGVIDNLSVLEDADDAALVNWGANWSMPTYEQWSELYKECTWTWTTQNDVNGRLVTGFNGNSIFLPAAGYRGAKYVSRGGERGYYWSKSICLNTPNKAYVLYFNSSNVFKGNTDERCIGRSIRPVFSE